MYGNTAHNMRTLGIAFTSLIEAQYGIRLPYAIPPHVAALVMVHIKTVRACGPTYHGDNYDDAHNFLTFAQECDEHITNRRHKRNRKNDRAKIAGTEAQGIRGGKGGAVRLPGGLQHL